MLMDVCFGHCVEAETEEEAVQKAAEYFLHDPNATAMVGPHVGKVWGQSFQTVVRLRDGAKTNFTKEGGTSNVGQRTS